MSDKHSIKYSAYIDKESGNMVCQQLNCNYSIQVYDMAQNMSAIYINTSPNPQSQIEFYANNSTNTQSTTYSNCNLGINENNFYLYNMNGGIIWNTDLLTNVSTFYMPITIANTLTADNINITNTLTADQLNVTTSISANNLTINATSTTDAIIVNGNSNTAAGSQFAFNNGTARIWNIGPNFTYGGGKGLNDFLFYNLNLGYNQILIQYENAIVDINSSLNVSDSVNISGTLTANTIVPTAANTGTIGTSSLSYYNAYVDHAYLGFIDTLVYMQNGASFYGPINILNPGTGDVIFTLTVNNSNQLNFESAGQTSPLTIDAGSNTLNLPSDLIASGSVSCTTLTATTINATGASISSTLTATTINATGASISSTLTATTINATTLNPNNTVATYSGSTTGNIYVTEPFTGNGYKKVVVFATNYTGSNTITYSTAFTTLAMITSNTYTYSSSSSTALPAFTTTLTEISIASDDELSIMSVVVEGY